MTLLNSLIYLNSILFLIIILPVGGLIIFLWQHLEENGPTQSFRKVILILSISKFIYFMMEIVAAYFILQTKLEFSIKIIIPILIGTFLVTAADLYALVKIIKLQRDQ